MTLTKRPLGWIAVGALWAVVSGLPAAADDTEIFIGTSGVGVQPNILFIIDDSTSMAGKVDTQPDYIPTFTYPALAGCVSDRIYWKTGTAPLPVCTGSPDRWLVMAAMKCNRAISGFNTAGFYSATMAAQYNPAVTATTGRWEALLTSQNVSTSTPAHARVVECYDDHGVHGGVTGDLVNTYAQNGPNQAGNGTGYWGTVATEVSWGQAPINNLSHYFYTGNYLNYLKTTPVKRSRLSIVQDVATDVLDTVGGVNVGFMDFNLFKGDFTNGSQGGHVAHAIEDIDTARALMKQKINALTACDPQDDPNPPCPTSTLTSTPLAETLYEAALYFKGGPVTYGNAAPLNPVNPLNSVPESRVNGQANGANYESPIDAACQKNFVVLLSDGEPTWDNAADTSIRDMRDAVTGTFATLVPGGTCDNEPWGAIDFPDPPNGQLSHCVDDLAEFLHDGDFSSTFNGTQNITTYTVGFTQNLPVLDQAAQRGGGEYYQANDAGQLTTALTNIVASILSYDTTFTSPTVAVNAFNRTENLSDLFVSVFRPSALTHWPGNLKKYRLNNNGIIVDATPPPDTQAAVDASTGFFSTTARSYWSAAVDGSNVELGGAANALPAPASRVVYSNLMPQTNGVPLDLSVATPANGNNRITTANTTYVTDSLLGTNNEPPLRAQIIDYINGVDTSDYDQDNVVNEARKQLGDPLHSQPASVVYGPGIRQGLIFLGTNDGYLHAIDMETGVEQWAFIPKEFLDDQVQLWEDDPASSKHFGIDGNMRVYIKADGDNVWETAAPQNERAYLFFGLRRGGMSYYGLDITDKLAPKLMWRLDGSSTNLPGIGQTWSTPVPAKINVGSATQNADKLVLVLGGGYEPDQDNDAVTADTTGNSIYIVDALSGARLWRGTLSGGDKSFNTVAGRNANMSYSFPGDIRVIDINNDGLADRMYAADMGGQVWRFDIKNGDPAATLVNGAVIAQLGAAPNHAAALPENRRRFYNAPDVAFVNTPTDNFIHVGIGSGHREHPLGLAVHDRFYALRDYGLSAKTQALLDDIVPTTDSGTTTGVTPITSPGQIIDKGGRGWRLDLSLDGWIGEKVLAEARTIKNEIFFSTYRPGSTTVTCTPQAGTNRHYRMALLNGSPVLNLDAPAAGGALTMDDVAADGVGGAISTSTQVLFLSADQDQDGTPDNVDTDDDNDGILDVNETVTPGQDSDGDGIPDSIDPDAQAADNAWRCTDLGCERTDFDNNPIRTFWTQEALD